MTRTGRFITSVLWPVVLIIKFTQYALLDNPTHFLVWKAPRPLHAAVYFLAIVLVAATIKRTPIRWLNAKAYVVTTIALTSAVADLLLDGAFRRTSATAMSWVLIGTANLGLVMWRTAHPNQDGRA